MYWNTPAGTIDDSGGGGGGGDDGDDGHTGRYEHNKHTSKDFIVSSHQLCVFLFSSENVLSCLSTRNLCEDSIEN